MNYSNYIYYLKTNFKNFRKKVINAMISYYGEEYRGLINKRLDETNFIFYGNVKDDLVSPKQNRFLKKEIIYKTMDTDCATDYQIKRSFKDGNASYITMYDFENEVLKKFVIFPIYLDDETLIHEMIHAITNTTFARIKDNNKKYLDSYTKSGLITTKHQGEILLEETITEIEANRIYKILKSNGFKSFIREYDYTSEPCYYDNFFPIIDFFYETFFKDITYSRITTDKSSLLDKIDIHNYIDLINYISCYEEELRFKRKNKYYPLIENTVSKMENNYKVKKLI